MKMTELIPLKVFLLTLILCVSELLTEAQQAVKQSHNEAEQLRSKSSLTLVMCKPKLIRIYFVCN